MIVEVPDDVVPRTLEPEKCAGWEWHPYDEIPRPTFLPLEKLVHSAYRLVI